VAVPTGFSAHQKSHNPAASPGAHSPRCDWADAEAPPEAISIGHFKLWQLLLVQLRRFAHNSVHTYIE
jgi:hypothetical protein